MSWRWPAIIDNNYDENSQLSNQYEHQDSSDLQTTPARDKENNLGDATSLREPVKAQMATKKNTRQRKLHRKGENTNVH